jgi:membrane-associated phospholipid phosphatase
MEMNGLRVARVTSVALHPFVIGPLTAALATRNWRLTAILAAITILPLVVLLIRRTRRGEWSDFDVSRRDQRPGLYYAALPALAVTALVVWRMGASASFLRSLLAIAFLFAAGLLGNRFLKISLHMMFGAFCLSIIARLYPWSLFLTLPLLASLAWSRWRLERHTPAEIAVGLLLGAIAGAFTLFF